jgi:hypothetical protein
MARAHHRLFEITRQVQGDSLGNALMDEVLTACFDFALGNGDALASLVLALDRLNLHLSGYGQPVAAGLFQGTPNEVSRWAEQLTGEILANGDSEGGDVEHWC